MAAASRKKPSDFITPLYINGMHGRMLHMPAPKGKRREILFVYGHHSSLERWWGALQDINQYGAVTMPDLPGFGGMDSFYKIGQKPTIDNLADYLATFIKLRYRNKQITIMGMSFGFVIVTRMLQRYPSLVKKVDLLISVVGFSHHDDFSLGKKQKRAAIAVSNFFSKRVPVQFFKNVLLHPMVLRAAYSKTPNAKHKFKDIDKNTKRQNMDFEVYLWRVNDPRTHMFTYTEFLQVNNCNKRINLPVWHISVKADAYFDNHVVEQHMRVIFSDFHEAKSRSSVHAPSILADKAAASKMIPAKIRQLLSAEP